MSAIEVLKVNNEVDVKGRLEKIKSKGYWHVNIRPIEFEERRIESLDRCWDVVESCSVYLRGWPYPYYPRVDEREKASRDDDWVQSSIDFNGIVELWRFYQSGQFIHYFSCLEDYRINEAGIYKPMIASRGLSILSTLYRITEIYEFTTRLALKNVFQDAVQISIKLVGMKDRELFEWNRMAPLKRISKDDEIVIESRLSVLNLIASAHDEAINKTMEVYSHFGLTDYPRMLLSSDQKRLLEKRL